VGFYENITIGRILHQIHVKSGLNLD